MVSGSVLGIRSCNNYCLQLFDRVTAQLSPEPRRRIRTLTRMAEKLQHARQWAGLARDSSPPSQLVPARIALARALVAHHSCARLEADERGLRASWLPSSYERSRWSPMPRGMRTSTGPDGQDFAVTVRLGEIRVGYRVRYWPDHLRWPLRPSGLGRWARPPATRWTCRSPAWYKSRPG